MSQGDYRELLSWDCQIQRFRDSHYQINMGLIADVILNAIAALIDWRNGYQGKVTNGFAVNGFTPQKPGSSGMQV